MELTVNIPQKRLKEVLSYYLDNLIYLNFDPAVIKKTRWQSKAKLIAELLEDETFLSKMQQQIVEKFSEFADEDLLYDVLCELQIPQIDALEESCNTLQDELEIPTRIQQLTDELNAFGYDVVKRG